MSSKLNSLNTTHLCTYSLICSTHVAGTACGAKYGVSSNCQLCSVKVLGADGTGSSTDSIAGLNHVVKQCSVSGSLCVANMSLSSNRVNGALNKAVNDAVAAGVVVVVAAGNSDVDACSISPAGAASAITVGSTTRTDVESWFSNSGPCVDVYAPGSDIKSAWITSTTATKTISGTSMAAPRTFLFVLLV